MYRAGGLRVLQFLNGFEYAQPHYLAVHVALIHKGISPFHRLNGGAITVPVNEQLGSAVDAEFAYDLRLAPGFFRGFA